MGGKREKEEEEEKGKKEARKGGRKKKRQQKESGEGRSIYIGIIYIDGISIYYILYLYRRNFKA